MPWGQHWAALRQQLSTLFNGPSPQEREQTQQLRRAARAVHRSGAKAILEVWEPWVSGRLPWREEDRLRRTGLLTPQNVERAFLAIDAQGSAWPTGQESTLPVVSHPLAGVLEALTQLPRDRRIGESFREGVALAKVALRASSRCNPAQVVPPCVLWELRWLDNAQMSRLLLAIFQHPGLDFSPAALGEQLSGTHRRAWVDTIVAAEHRHDQEQWKSSLLPKTAVSHSLGPTASFIETVIDAGLDARWGWDQSVSTKSLGPAFQLLQRRRHLQEMARDQEARRERKGVDLTSIRVISSPKNGDSMGLSQARKRLRLHRALSRELRLLAKQRPLCVSDLFGAQLEAQHGPSSDGPTIGLIQAVGGMNPQGLPARHPGLLRQRVEERWRVCVERNRLETALLESTPACTGAVVAPPAKACKAAPQATGSESPRPAGPRRAVHRL